MSGRVQMVMYRDFATRKARGLKLVGEVENLPDGTVRVIAEGQRTALNQFIEKLKKGSLLSRVDHVDVAFKPASSAYRTFDIVYG